MKKMITVSVAMLLGISLTACGNQQQSHNSSSAKVTSSKVQNHHWVSSQSSSSTQTNHSNQASNNSATTALSNDQVAERFRAIKGYQSTDYDILVNNNHDGTYNIEVRRRAPDPQITNMIGTYVYNPTTGAVTTTFESGLQ